MALQILGDEVMQGGKTVDRGAHHGDAVRAAQARSHDVGNTVGFQPTAHMVAAIDFAGAEPYVTKIDVLAARARDAAVQDDPEKVAELLEEDDAAIALRHRQEVRVKQPGYRFRLGENWFDESGRVVLFADGSLKAYDEEAFAAGFEKIAAEPKRAKKGDAQPPAPDSGSADRLAAGQKTNQKGGS